MVARILASLASSDLGSVVENLARYDVMRRDQPSAYPRPSCLSPRRRISMRSEAIGATPNPHFARPWLPLTHIAAAWADPADRSRFLELQAAVLAEAGECLRVLNKRVDAERLIEPLLSTANPRAKTRRTPRCSAMAGSIPYRSLDACSSISCVFAVSISSDWLSSGRAHNLPCPPVL